MDGVVRMNRHRGPPAGQDGAEQDDEEPKKVGGELADQWKNLPMNPGKKSGQ